MADQFDSQHNLEPAQITPAAQAQSTSGLAIAGMVLGIIALVTIPLPIINFGSPALAIIGLILSIAGRSSIKKGNKKGKGIATAGIVLCAIVTALALITSAACSAAVSSRDSSSASAAATAPSNTSVVTDSSKSASTTSNSTTNSSSSSVGDSTSKKTSGNATQSSKSSAVNDDQVNPDLKEALDSYEAFMDEYVEFMKSYQESGDATSMLQDYTDYLQRYSEFTRKIDKLDTKDMSSADYAYYIDVTARVSKKLLEASNL